MRLLTLLLLTCILPLQADILANSNFADGRAHWKGDAQDAETADSHNLARAPSGNSAGVVIKLQKDKWNKIYQNLTLRDAKLLFTITFQLSADYKLTSQNNDDRSAADFSDVPEINKPRILPEQYWRFIMAGGSNVTRTLQPDLTKKGQQQTLSGRFSDLTINSEAVFLIAFPPGKGSVTLYNVSLSATDPNAEP